MRISVFSMLLVLQLVAGPALAGLVVVPGFAGGSINVKVTSIKEARFLTTVKQKHDFSCGSAAVATLLSYHYEDQVTEDEIFTAMFEAGNQEKIQTYGFSLLDMKKYLQKRGYVADGFRTSLDKLATFGVPAIVLINNNGYRHFVVVKGVFTDEVLVGDPSLGIQKMPRPEFESMWNGLLFLIRNKKQVANRHFNTDAEWDVVVKAPLGMALAGSELANVTWMLKPASDF